MVYCSFAAVLHRKQRWVRIWHHFMPSYAIPMPSLSPLRCSKSWYDMIWVDDYDPRRQLNRRVCIQLAKPSFSQSWSHHSIVTKFPNLEKIRPKKRGHGPWDATRNQPLMSSRFSVAHLQHLAKSSGWFNSIHLTRLCMVHYGTKKWNTAKTAWPFPRSECCRAQPKSANMSAHWAHALNPSQQCLAT